MSKNTLLSIVGALILLIICIAVYIAFGSQKAAAPQPPNNTKPTETSTSSTISEAEARSIAEKTCVKGGEALSNGSYNPYSATWWFDANLNATRPGCFPACVVSEKTKTAEINWRCTGAIAP
jgi:hypothetical protein